MSISTAVGPPRHRAPLVRRAVRRVALVARSPWLRGYARGWNEAMGHAVDDLEALLAGANGQHVLKADVKAVALRLRREAEH